MTSIICCKKSDNEMIHILSTQIDSTITSITDAVIAFDRPEENFSNSSDLISIAWTCDTGLDTCIQRSLLKFDLSYVPDNATVMDARLSLFANEGSLNPAHFGINEASLFKLISNWNESSVNWNNQPDYTLEDRIDFEQSDSSNQHYNDIEMTKLVQFYADNPSLNHGLVLRLRSENIFRSLNFASSDHPNPDLRPELKVIYEFEN